MHLRRIMCCQVWIVCIRRMLWRLLLWLLLLHLLLLLLMLLLEDGYLRGILMDVCTR